MSAKISIGTVQFGLRYGISNTAGKTSVAEVAKILDLAKSVGITTLDTATDYGDCEKILGGYGVYDWNVGSKIPAVPNDCVNIYQWCQAIVEQSLANLRVECLGSVLLHRPLQLLEPRGAEIFDALSKLKLKGLTDKIGISVYSSVELSDLVPKYKFDIVQAPSNILSRSLVETSDRNIQQENPYELHVRSVFLQGLLVMPAAKRPFKSGDWSEIWRVWDQWLVQENLSPVEACVRYIFNVPQISKIVFGIESVRQLQRILAVSRAPLRTLPNWPKIDDDMTNPAKWKLE
jgi:aryl-alcohol dehydrogenase-like predicted oxidoreductase